jgi:hypothetical protein
MKLNAVVVVVVVVVEATVVVGVAVAASTCMSVIQFKTAQFTTHTMHSIPPLH